MTSRVFSYSPDNKYAYEYYQACKKFDNIQSKVVNYENKTEDRESAQYKKLMAEFEIWNAEVPKTSNLAGQEEVRLQAQGMSKDKSRQGEKLDLMG